MFFAAVLAGFALLGLVGIGLGLLVTDVLLHTGGLAGTDESTVRSLVAERTPFLTDVSEVGSTLGGAPLLPVLVGVIALVCALLRKWRIAAFALFALVVESATYRVTSLAGAARASRRQAPRGPARPTPASRPATPRRRSRSTPAWSCSHLAVPGRALARARLGGRDPASRSSWPSSRMYRGMHHPLDVAGGLVIGIGALLVLLFACRSAGAAHQARSPRAASVATSRRAQPVA